MYLLDQCHWNPWWFFWHHYARALQSWDAGLPVPCGAWWRWASGPLSCPRDVDICVRGGEDAALWGCGSPSIPEARYCTVWGPVCCPASQAGFSQLWAELAGTEGGHASHAKDTMWHTEKQSVAPLPPTPNPRPPRLPFGGYSSAPSGGRVGGYFTGKFHLLVPFSSTPPHTPSPGVIMVGNQCPRPRRWESA